VLAKRDSLEAGLPVVRRRRRRPAGPLILVGEGRSVHSDEVSLFSLIGGTWLRPLDISLADETARNGRTLLLVALLVDAASAAVVVRPK
jgi:hypothetical protein